MSEKTYPMYEVNVIDKSIYNFSVEEVLPVHRAVWVLPTEKGPVGEPIWVKDKKQFDRIFGKQTLALYTNKYKSPASFWLYNLLQKNGQFIVRGLPDTAKKAAIVIEAYVRKVTKGKPKYAKVDGGEENEFATVQNHIISRLSGDEAENNNLNPNCISDFNDYGKRAVEVDSVEVTKVIAYLNSDGTAEYWSSTKKNANGDYSGPTNWFQRNTNGGSRTLESAPQDDTLENYTTKELFYHTITPKTEDSLRITFVKREASSDELAYMDDDSVALPKSLQKRNETYTIGSGEQQVTGTVTIYPLLFVAANYPGQYGNDYAFRFFSDGGSNNEENVAWFKSVFNCFGAYNREFNTSTTNPIRSKYGKNYLSFSADPSCVDLETRVKKDMESVLERGYDNDAEDTDEFPFVIYSFENNLKLIGEEIIKIENYNGAALGFDNIARLRQNDCAEFMEFVGGKTQEDENAEGLFSMNTEEDHDWGKAGYMVDVLGGTAPNGNPYPSVEYSNGARQSTAPFVVVDTQDVSAKINASAGDIHYYVSAPEEDTQEGTLDIDGDVITLSRTENIYLVKGQDCASDEKIWDDSENGYVMKDFMDKIMYDFVTLHTNEKILDKFRYPFTHVYDIGYSMTTKFAMEDFTDIRDDVGVSLTPQVLLSSKWATGLDRTVKINDMEMDIENGLVLRNRAMLMKESILHDTDCMRISIFTQAGRPVDSVMSVGGVYETIANSTVVPFTFWDAMKHAEYGNKPYMSITEPRGWPEAKNDLFKYWGWVPYKEPMKEETWNSGLNYCQYGNMREIFYPALRTVYRHETSILVDQWDVDALIYMKHECRYVWARFVGRNDKRAVLQAGIKKELEKRLSKLLSNKYEVEVEVYQTEEEQKKGYIQHVRLRITFPATLRQIIYDIEVNREGYNPEE